MIEYELRDEAWALLILFFIFMTLRLCGEIHWSWWWVSAPIWVAPLFFTIGDLVKRVIMDRG